ncbi:MAG: GDP-mannose 4,6-dehydratase [Bryobacterales bacterium]|nr:GDP-mannose 4,6-dehydratase [Bryobacterales bacterium]MBV9398756.1 GDP-mannose 4,6-dehydratase [Bryobacterales bacterium]
MAVNGFWSGRRVFVTGATGLLGSWLTEALVGQGAGVICLVRDWVPQSRLARSEIWESVNVVRGELEDLQLLIRALNEYEIDTVFHLGAQTIVGTAARSALSTFESNIRGTWNLLEACRNCSKLIRHIVVASSDKAYGAHDQLPYSEDMPLQGRFPYDVSKSCADLLTLSYFHTYGLPVAITRCGNLFGGGDLNFNRLIPGTIRSILRGEAPVIRSDGTYIRDYFYVRDAVEAYLLLAENLVPGEAFNFGNETPLSVLEMAKMIIDLMPGALEPVILNEASHEIPKQYLDCGKARKVLNWKPRFGMKEGLKETIDWYSHSFGKESPFRDRAFAG